MRAKFNENVAEQEIQPEMNSFYLESTIPKIAANLSGVNRNKASICAGCQELWKKSEYGASRKRRAGLGLLAAAHRKWQTRYRFATPEAVFALIVLFSEPVQ